MTADPFRPGDHRAGDAFTGPALVAAMVEVEAAWAEALEQAALVPGGVAAALSGYVCPDVEALSAEAEDGGNPLIPLLARLRRHVGPAGNAVHRGLTSQDVIDTALMVMSAHAADELIDQLGRQLDSLAVLARAHRETPALARTLGQPARGTVFGLRVLAWRDGIRHARQLLLEWRSTAPVQLGGPVGDRAEITEVAGPETAAVIRATATSLRLVPHRPWPTTRGPVTDLAHALVTATSAWGHLANDVLLMSSSELGEVSEPRSRERGGSSSMPHKHNSVLSILLRRCARSTPLLQAQLQLAATDSVQERSPGGWHGEWPALRDLWRQVLAAGDQATELVRGLEVHGERMEANLQAARVPTMDAVAAGELIDRALEDG